MKTVAIVNPMSGYGQASRKWPRLLEESGDEAAHVVTWWAEGPGHAEALAAQARREGYERVIAAGGDGTLSEVVNGLWWEPDGKLPSVGTVPLGTGCDYARNFELGQRLNDNLAAALGRTLIPVDLGTCRLEGLDGEPLRRAFLNMLGLGCDGDVAKRFRSQRAHIPGRAAYVVCVLQELVRPPSYRLDGEIDGNRLQTDVLTVAVGLGRWTGGGMMITPSASPVAGRFHLLWVQHLSRLGVLGLFSKLYSGRHVDHPRVHSRPARRLELTVEPPAYVEADGELIGRTPIKIELRPSAIQFAAKEISGC